MTKKHAITQNFERLHAFSTIFSYFATTLPMTVLASFSPV